MGILEECLAGIKVNVPGGKVDEILASLPKEDAKSLLAALKEKSISGNRIVDVLRQRGIKIGKESVRAWRKREGISQA
jgi:hypothetical protein